MKVGVYGQFYQNHPDSYIKTLLNTLHRKGIEVFVETVFFERIKSKLQKKYPFKTFSSYHDLDTSYDLIFTIGGDGTILRAVTYIRDLGIPVLGINTGRLGFLATIQKEEIENAVELIIDKEYTIVERSLLSATAKSNNSSLKGFHFALNEVAVNRKNSASMIRVEAALDHQRLNSYWADGLIISTPTGSTGYSLSCGGPVIMPDAKNLVVTPIAPHNLNVRPLVIPDDKEITLKVSGREKQFLISLDSRVITLNNETEIRIKKADFMMKMALLKNENFLETLRKKLFWGEDKRN